MVAPGEILGGKYQVERIIGAGGMGLVIAARHLHLDQRVAVKLLSSDHVGQPAIVDRFVREARASVRLRSEHVARVLDAGRFDDGTPYLVMEYLEGRDLAAELAELRRLPVAVAIDCMLQVCEAVAEAHQLGIIHRDLKPANIFVTRDGDGSPLVKVLDFGISKVADDVSDLTSTKMVLGSPPYMSPEQLRASRNVDARSDVWSLGVVLYELVSGRRPFMGETLTDLALRITTDPPDPLAPDGSAALEVAIGRCLAKAPAARYATVADFAAALAPFADARGQERIQRIQRRLPAAIASQSAANRPATGGPTTLSAATGTLDPGPVRTRSRYLLIGGVAIVLSAVAVGAAVAIWPANGSTGAAAVRPAPPAPSPIDPPSAPPATDEKSAAVARPSSATAPGSGGTAAPSGGTKAPSTATTAPSGATAFPPRGTAAPSIGTSPPSHPIATVPGPVAPVSPSASSSRARPSVPVRPAEVRNPPKPTPKPPIRRPARPGPGSADPAEDLTKSQY